MIPSSPVSSPSDELMQRFSVLQILAASVQEHPQGPSVPSSPIRSMALVPSSPSRSMSIDVVSLVPSSPSRSMSIDPVPLYFPPSPRRRSPSPRRRRDRSLSPGDPDRSRVIRRRFRSPSPPRDSGRDASSVSAHTAVGFPVPLPIPIHVAFPNTFVMSPFGSASQTSGSGPIRTARTKARNNFKPY